MSTRTINGHGEHWKPSGRNLYSFLFFLKTI
jgi:hypothetical protein